MSHANPQPRTSFPPATSAQPEAALFDRLIDVCDRQDDLIRRQQAEIERLREQLAGLPAKVEPHRPSPPQAEVRSMPKASTPKPLTPPQFDSPSTIQKALSSAQPDERPTSGQPAKETAAMPKACLPKGFPTGHAIPEGPIPRREAPTPKPKATRHHSANSFTPPDHRAPSLPDRSLQREIAATSRQPLPPLHPDGELPKSDPRKVGPPRSGNNRVRELLNQYFDRVPKASSQVLPDTSQASAPPHRRHWPEPVERWPRSLSN
ncbi:hypothetical protein C5Y96_12890 [Blastopirellula marina]|uniref:Uncharacterized protein n=1 Tax=Blastopirellula marina TaxID=124 RepID=A0A2S8FGC9_9BACT|nr:MULTISPECIES: hypothetical protein [Pirellulaceae]PQO31235.1 hypothetical protein C5Y96_12890 [Blastopirellula marina]RCS51629.1 hypothetical protein DTL36_12900 [Bremerella cremea]